LLQSIKADIVTKLEYIPFKVTVISVRVQQATISSVKTDVGDFIKR
jgi:hypothetical protein